MKKQEDFANLAHSLLTNKGNLRSVRLSVKDWRDLTNFVNGDLVNMPEQDPVKIQMRRICDTINSKTF